MGRKKDLIHAPKKCGGLLETQYNQDNLPYLVCDKCAFEIQDWVKWETQYKGLWESKASWEDKKNHLTVLLGYFCAKYKDYYEIDYTLSLNEKGLFRGPEINVLRRVYSMLNSDPWVVKEYIDYVFAVKIHKRKKKISSLSFLAVADIVQEYKLAAKRAEKVDRDTVLPDKMLEWVKIHSPDVIDFVSLNDFGDLKLLLTHYKDGHMQGNKSVDFFVDKLQKMGYVDSTLSINNWRET
jgi:hypothetical protein